jgi:hypothetical protein
MLSDTNVKKRTPDVEEGEIGEKSDVVGGED